MGRVGQEKAIPAIKYKLINWSYAVTSTDWPRQLNGWSGVSRVILWGQGTRRTTKSSVVLPRPELYLWGLRLCFGRGMPSSDSELDVLLPYTMWKAASSRHARSATLGCPAAVAARAEALASIGLVTCGMAALVADAKPCGCCGIGVLCGGGGMPLRHARAPQPG